MHQRFTRAGLFATALLAAGFMATGVGAQSSDGYFKGKTVRLVVGAGAGGVYGAIGRVTTRHMPKYLPGEPTMVLEHMTGAGGIRISNWLYNVAPGDGSVIGMQLPDATAIQAHSPWRIKYDARKFNWLSSWGEAINVLSVHKDCTPVRTLEEAGKTEVILGGFSPNSSNYQYPVLVNHLLKTRFKMVAGYRGGGAIRNAIDKCEVAGWAGFYLGWVTGRPQWIEQDKLTHLVQFALHPGDHPILRNVPVLIDMTDNPDDKAVFRFVSLSGFIARALTTPPATPAHVNEAIDSAFSRMLKDPAFLADAERVKLPIKPFTAQQVRERVAEVLSTPKAVTDRYVDIVGLKRPEKK